jgi:hypothetical protein
MAYSIDVSGKTPLKFKPHRKSAEIRKGKRNTSRNRGTKDGKKAKKTVTQTPSPFFAALRAFAPLR